MEHRYQGDPQPEPVPKRDLSDNHEDMSQERVEPTQSEQAKSQGPQIDRDGINIIDTDKAYNKTVTVEINGLREETKQERLERKMREWDEAQKDKTQQHTKTHEM